MSGRYNGSYMRAYKILPVREINAASLSSGAKKRLWWLDWYHSHGQNAEATCRYFGISKSVFYRWRNRYNPKHIRSLEDDKRTRRPHRLRVMTTSPRVIKRIYDIRKNDPEKSKWEIHEERKRQGVFVAYNVIQKAINRHPHPPRHAILSEELENISHSPSWPSILAMGVNISCIFTRS